MAKDKKQKDAKEFKQARNWCFTDYEFLNWEEIYNKYNDIIRYICVGKEICPTTKRPHNQGWIQFKTKRTRGGVKRIIGCNKTFLDPCIADETLNDKYCKKDGDFLQIGTFIKQGGRTDLEMIKKLIDNETSMKEIADDYFDTFCRNYKAFEKYRELTLQEKYKEFRKVEVIVIEGKTGQGKTKTAMEHAEYKIQADDLQWWDGYNGQKCILIDEYNGQLPITKMLGILDGYQLRLPIKGGHTYAYWNKVYITTNKNWNEWHPNAHEEHKNALLRRITKWITL